MGHLLEVVVIGAGEEAVNGVYKRVDAPCDFIEEYAVKGVWAGENGDFRLYRSAGYAHERWQIESLRSYRVVYWTSSKSDTGYPPLTGWEIHKSISALPPPFLKLGSVQDPKMVTGNLQKLLFSEKHSDVKFACNDNVLVHAHKTVLAASSSYFETAFDGPWKENESGEWKIPYSSHIWKAVLTFLYTGVTNLELMRKKPFVFARLVSEYELDKLKVSAEESCIESVNDSNVKDMLQAAHLYDLSKLRSACTKFVKENSLNLLQKGEFCSLKTENPVAWDELWTAIRK